MRLGRIANLDHYWELTSESRSPAKMELTLYIKPWCPWCIEAIEWLEERGYRYKKIDVLSDSTAYERMRKISKQSLTPTLETSSGLVLPDFDVAQLERFMLQHALLP
jgi:glutaredoxin 3